MVDALQIIRSHVLDPERPNKFADGNKEIVPGDAHSLRVSAPVDSLVARIEMRVEIFECKFSWTGPLQLIPIGVVSSDVVSYDPRFPDISLTFKPIPAAIKPSPKPLNHGFRPGTGTHLV